MITFLLIILVLVYIFRSDISSTPDEIKKNKFSDGSYHKPQKVTAANLRVADTILLSNGEKRVITEIKSSSTPGRLIFSFETKRVIIDSSANYFLENGVYIHEKRVNSNDISGNVLVQTKNYNSPYDNGPLKPIPNQDLSKSFVTRVAGVTYEGRQNIIARLSPSYQIYIKREYNNAHDQNAIGVYLFDGRQIGWLPAELAIRLAKIMDGGAEYTTRIKQILGGNGYRYGVEIEVSEKGKYEKSSIKPSYVKRPESTFYNDDYDNSFDSDILYNFSDEYVDPDIDERLDNSYEIYNEENF